MSSRTTPKVGNLNYEGRQKKLLTFAYLFHMLGLFELKGVQSVAFL